MTTQMASRLEDTDHILRNIQDYARAVKLLTWQRQGIIASVALLTGWFFSPWRAELFFAVGMMCEYVDLTLARKVDRIAPDDRQATRYAYAGFIANTVVSASAISIYAIWVGQTEDGVGLFMNRTGFAGDQLLHFTRPYRARHAAHSSWLQPRQAGCSRWVQAVGGC